MAVWVLIAGLVGAKLLLVGVEWRYFAKNPRDAFSIFQSGGVFYGGLMAGILVAWLLRSLLRAPRLAHRRRPRPRRRDRPGDRPARLLLRRLLLGQGHERAVGGHVHGRLRGARGRHADRHAPPPEPAVRVGRGRSCIFLFLVWLAPRKRFHGQVTLAYVALYSAARFVLEFWRGDSDRGTWFGNQVSTSQLIALALLVATAIAVPYVRRTQATTPEPAAA